MAVSVGVSVGVADGGTAVAVAVGGTVVAVAVGGTVVAVGGTVVAVGGTVVGVRVGVGVMVSLVPAYLKVYTGEYSSQELPVKRQIR